MAQKILLYTSSIVEAIDEVTALGGFVPIQLSQRVFAATFLENFDVTNLKFSSQEKPSDLDENSSILANAWEDMRKKVISKQISGEKPSSLSWNDKEHDYPRNPKNDPELLEILRKKGIAELTPALTSQTMNGRIAVGILVVSGPANYNLTFSSEEFYLVMSEVLDALDYLAGACYEANITFITIPYNMQIDAPPNNTCNSYESCEQVFVNPTLQALGYPAGNEGCVQLTQDLQRSNNANWAYIAFFTKYPLYHFAYQYDVNVFMQYSNDGWGPYQIDKVFAHETCHVFGAADEYSLEAGYCNCHESGFYRVPNNNCANCAYAPKVGCLMDANELSLCNWSRGQIGWGYWNLPFRTMPGTGGASFQSTSASPALAYFKGKMYIAFKSNNANNQIIIGSSSKGIWGNFYSLSQQSTSDAPALAVFNDTLFLAWKANDNSNKIYYAMSTNGVNWTWPSQNNYLPGQSTSAAPALAGYNGKIYIAWKANDPSNRIFYGSSLNGTSWASSYSSVPDQATSAAPALAAFKDRLFLAWKANDDSNRIYYAYSTNGTTWSWPAFDNHIPGQSTSTSPALAGFKNRIYIAWKASNASNKIYYGSSLDGLTWGHHFPSIESTTTSAAPAIAGADDTNLIMAIKANDASNDVLVNNYVPGLF